MRLVQLAIAALVASAAPALAQGTPAQQGATAALKPAVVYDLGGKFDKSFNEGVYAGAEKFKKETGVEYRDFEPQNEAQKEQALRRFARDGHLADRRRRLQPAGGAREGRDRVPEPALRDHRRGGRQAERPLDHLQGARGLLSGRPARRDARRRPARSASSAAWTSR